MSASPHTAGAKAALRRHYRQVRRQALEQGGSQLVERISAAAQAIAAELLADQPGNQLHLGIYWPLAGEIDLRPLARQLPVALPAIHGQRLVYRPWRPGQPLEPDDCGILAPPAAAGALQPGQLGLLLVPALAIDPAGIRLGYGGGWYDRLRAEATWRQVPALAVLPAACCHASLPRDPWDVPLSGWINERGGANLTDANLTDANLTNDSQGSTNPRVICQDSNPCTGRSVERLRLPS
jgi:5-formyltetrahydrofolate cyclo-ligase